MLFDDQTLHDLEFDTIRQMLVQYCIGPTAHERMANLGPHPDITSAITALDQCAELLQVRQEAAGFPRIEFEELSAGIQRLRVPGAVLDKEAFVHLLDASRLVNDVLLFLKNRAQEFPRLTELSRAAWYSTDIIDAIEKVLDKRFGVKDDASPALRQIRQDIRNTRTQINKNFERIQRKLMREGMLAETGETYLNDRRVLSVLSSNRRQVPGSVLGSSNTGSITYIEPHENMPLNNDLEMLLDDERKEIRRIFLALTDHIRQHLPLVEAYQHILTELDFINAKVRLALKLDATRPALADEQHIELLNAYHPLLLLTNKAAGKTTIPQSLTMDKFSRMLVISGPNAGGKSITLKTVGLLQVMVQCGLLVPADASSHFGWFQHILSDIGDNQSIANQLSTYSYRLKRMKYFLETANKRTLLLLDEFGTGSDPELGGALAEVFFETLYNRKSFGVITTHYANIKLKAGRLQNAVNASMLFDSQSLEPLFRLSIGQPGSSFTFEVAQINGIPQDLIEEAKTRLDANKVEMDKLIATVQKEKFELERLTKNAQHAQAEAQTAKEEYETLNQHYQERLARQHELIERNNKELSSGRRMMQFIERYRLKAGNKDLLEEVRKFLAIEKGKIERKKEEAKIKATQKASLKPSQKPIKAGRQEPKTPPKPVVVGATVHLKNATQHGQVAEITGQDAIVLFGNFKTRVKVRDLVAV